MNRIEQATEALRRGYTIDSQYNCRHWLVAKIVKFVCCLFNHSFSDQNIKLRVAKDLESLQFAHLKDGDGKLWLDFIGAVQSSGNSRLADELFHEFKLQVSHIQEVLSPSSMNQEDLDAWSQFLIQLGCNGNPECRSFASTALRCALNDFEEGQQHTPVKLEDATAMLLLRNYNPALLKTGEAPRFSVLLDSWIKFTGRTEFSDCLLLQRELENPDVKLDDTILRQPEDRSNPIWYVPFFRIKSNIYCQTILKITSNQGEGFVVEDLRFKDSVPVASLNRANVSELFQWNHACLHHPRVRSSLYPQIFNLRKEGGLRETLSKENDFYKPLRVFYAHLEESAKVRLKLDHSWQRFLEVVEGLPANWLQDSSLRQWFKGGLFRLQKQLQSYADLEDHDSRIVLERRSYCLQLTQRIDLFESELRHAIPAYSGISYSDTGKLETESTIEAPIPKDVIVEDCPPPVFKARDTIMPLWQVPSLQKDLTPDEYRAEAQLLTEWVNRAQELFDQRDFENLERICMHFLQQLPTPSEAKAFFDRLETEMTRVEGQYDFYYGLFGCEQYKKPLSRYTYSFDAGFSFRDNKFIDLWSLPFYRMNYFCLHTQLIKGRLVPQALKALLRGMALQEHLSSLSTTFHNHSSHPEAGDNMGRVVEALQSYACDLGEDSGEIFELIRLFRVSHTMKSRGKPCVLPPRKYWDHKPVYNCNDQVAACLWCESLCILNILCHPNFLTSQPQQKIDEDYLRGHGGAPDAMARVKQELCDGKWLRLGYGWRDTPSHRQRGVLVSINELYFRNMDYNEQPFQESIGFGSSGFAHLAARIVNPKIRSFIQEGLVTTRNRLAETSLGCGREFQKYQTKDAFRNVEDADSFFHNMLVGENKTSLVILREKEGLPGLTTKCFQDLQLMQTSSLSRAENTLLTFKKYPHLLAHRVYGQDLRIVFSLNLFRDAALYREFKNHPDKIERHFACISELIEYHSRKKNFSAWLFLIEIHRQMMQMLKNTRFAVDWDENLFVHLNKEHDIHLQKVFALWDAVQNTVDDSYTLSDRGALCQALLMYHVSKKTDFASEDALKDLAVLAVHFYHSGFKGVSEYHLSLIEEFLAKYSNWFQDLSAACWQDILRSIAPGSDKELWQRKDSHTWVFGTRKFQIDSFQVSFLNEVRGKLPREVREDAKLRVLDLEGALDHVQTLRAVSIAGFNGWQFSFEGRGYVYDVVLTSGEGRRSFVFRKKDGSVEQLVSGKVERNFWLSAQVEQAFCWKNLSDHTVRIENGYGKEVYREEQGRVIALSPEGKAYEPLNFSDLGPGSIFFTKLAGEGGVELLRSIDGDVFLRYSRYNAYYDWDHREHVWRSRAFPGYVISGIPLSSLVRATTEETGLEPLFRRSFQGYHLLEKPGHPSAEKKVLIAPVRYRPLANAAAKYQWELAIDSANDSLDDTLCMFSIDAEGQLRSNKSGDYLYLSYLLLSQRKYSDALHYLVLGQSVIDYQPAFWRTLTDWVMALPDAAPEAIAVKTRILLAEQQIRQYRRETMGETLTNDESLPDLMQVYATYKRLENQVPHVLKLAKKQEALILSLEPRAFSRDHKGIVEQPTWGLLNESYKCLMGSKVSSEKVIAQVLEARLQGYRQQVNKVQEREVKLPPAVASDLEPLDLTPYLKQKGAETSRVSSVVAELNELFNGTGYADQIGKNLINDIAYKQNAYEFGLVPGADLNPLLNKLKQYKNNWKQVENQVKQRLIRVFTDVTTAGHELQQKKLAERLQTLDEVIEQAKICYLNDDWQPLVDKGVVTLDQVQVADSLMDEFLTARTARKHWQRKQNGLQDYVKGHLHEDKFVELLLTQRSYQPTLQEIRRIYKVTEDSLNITIKETQLSALMQQIERPNAFKHAGTGFGKTSLQRHLILRITALQGLLSAQLTQRDLFQTHHKSLCEAQSQMFGAMVSPFLFKRGDTVDDYVLKQIEGQFLCAFLENSCVDHRVSDVMSFTHRFTTHILDKGEFSTLAQFQSVRKLMRSTMSVHSDELVTVLDPSRDHTFAYGNAGHLDEEFYTPCVDLFILLKDDPEFSTEYKCVSNNQLKHMSEAVFSQFLVRMAEKLIDHLDLSEEAVEWNKDCSVKYLTQQYLKENDSGWVIDYYENVILNLSEHNRAKMQGYHRYLEIFSQFRLKLYGVNFGRSQDGRQTKPFRKSAICLEESQRRDIATTVFETCYDYFIAGTANEADAFIESKKELAAREAKENNVEDEQTEVALRFQRDYNASLYSEIDPDTLHNKLNSSGKGIGDFLVTDYFPKYTYFPQKVDGNSCHVPNQYKCLGGSSGSAERIDTLPSSIAKDPVLSRQAGDVGAVFYHLITVFDEDRDFLQINPFKPVAAQLGPRLGTGDVFIDVVPFFPGVPAEDIAHQLRAHTHSPGQNMRFVDEQGHLRTLKTEEISSQTTGVLSQGHVEGTDWKFNNGIISHSADISFTSLYQSMRTRDLGRGQRLSIASDVDWNVVEAKNPQLKGRSTLAKIIYLSIVQEAESLKKLIYVLKLKEIPAIVTNAFDRVLDTVTDVESLNKLRELKESQDCMLSGNSMNLDEFGLPRQYTTPTEILEALVDRQKKLLKRLKNQIKGLAIGCDPSPLDDALKALKAPDLIPPKEKMPEQVIHQTTDIDGIEDMELEEVLDQVTEQAQELQLSAEVAVAQKQEIEQINYRRKISDEGHEILYSPFVEACSALLNQPVIDSNVDQQNSFPLTIAGHTVFVTSHVGGSPNGESGDHVLSYFWFGNATEQSAMSPKIAFIKHESREKQEVVFMSVKDADLFLQPRINKLPTQSMRFGPEQPNPQEQEFSAVSFDLRYQDSQGLSEADKERVVLAKLAYLDCPFSAEEVIIARELMGRMGDFENVNRSLQSYLKQVFFDSWKTHPLLT